VHEWELKPHMLFEARHTAQQTAPPFYADKRHLSLNDGVASVVSRTPITESTLANDRIPPHRLPQPIIPFAIGRAGNPKQATLPVSLRAMSRAPPMPTSGGPGGSAVFPFVKRGTHTFLGRHPRCAPSEFYVCPRKSHLVADFPFDGTDAGPMRF